MVYVFYVDNVRSYDNQTTYVGSYVDQQTALKAILDDSATFGRKMRDYMAIQGDLLVIALSQQPVVAPREDTKPR